MYVHFGISFWFTLLILTLHSQLWDRAELDTSFVNFEKHLPQPEIKGTRRIHLEIILVPRAFLSLLASGPGGSGDENDLEIRFIYLLQCFTRFSIFY